MTKQIPVNKPISIDNIDSERDRLSPNELDKLKSCRHLSVQPVFDEQLVRDQNLSPMEVRKRYPRFHGTCPDCKQDLILYASWSHYTYGDY